MSPLSAMVSSAPERGSSGVMLSSLLLAAPALLVAHAGPGVILAAVLFVGAAAFLELRPRARARLAEVVRPAPVPVRARVSSVPPRASWEVSERDGRRSLVMRWR